MKGGACYRLAFLGIVVTIKGNPAKHTKDPEKATHAMISIFRHQQIMRSLCSLVSMDLFSIVRSVLFGPLGGL